jgi:hypothetical protein
MFVPRLISSAVCALWPDSTEVWGILKMLFTAYHGSVAPTGPWRGTTAVLGEQMTW